MNSYVPPSGATRRSWARSIATLFAAFVLGGLVLPYLHVRVSWREPASEAEPGTGLDVRAAQLVYKAVVNIDSTQRVRLHGFFDDFFDQPPRYGERQEEGSGVIIDPSGYILTNEHVVGAAHDSNRKITVTLTDGRKFPGTVIGSDHTTDVALVKIEGNNFPSARLGTARGLVPGQMVIAIGNPFGFRFTVTHGVVSALGRPISSEDRTGVRIYPDLIQHDALINPGNSGGALVNLHGQVIGINTLVYSSGQGIGFAIPIDTALRVADELKRYGKIKRPWLGLITVTNSDELIRLYGLPDRRGAVVARLLPDSPAAQAGLQQGDVITRLNGKPIAGEEDFQNVEKSLRIGQRVKVEVQRGDQQGQGVITVGEAP